MRSSIGGKGADRSIEEQPVVIIMEGMDFMYSVVVYTIFSMMALKVIYYHIELTA